MLKSAGYTLAWSSTQQAYTLCEGREDEALDVIPDTLAWSVWVSQLSSFAFRGHHGCCTVRKEHRQRGGGYWYAYARVAGKLTKRYLGRDTELTLPRLEQVAQAFFRDAPAALPPKEGRAAPRHRPDSPTPVGEHVFLNHLSDAAVSWSEVTTPPGLRFASLSAAGPPSPGRDGDASGPTIQTKSASGDGLAQVSALYVGLSPDPLLASKLRAPPPRPHLVHRPRLLHRLDQGQQRALTLLSAPAGFGKSTLLADWLSTSPLPAAWLSLEPQDNDPVRFLTYLLAALQTPGSPLDSPGLARHYPLPLPPLQATLTLLLNDLQASLNGDPTHLVLVLDDYHVITHRSIHDALAFLLEHLPPHLHLVLATREDPPLPLARLRGRDDLLELRAADLRFTPAESATYLIEEMGLPLSAQQSALLQTRTEGWITGLHLAALSLLHHDDPTPFITAFSGSHYYIADYLLDEVLSRQTPAVQDFLLHTCLLERLCGPLCDAVRAQDDSAALLDALAHANLFLMPLDDERRWYRYHHLFAEALRQRLQQTAPHLVADLHRRACHWYEQQGLWAEAVAHALAAPAFAEAARLIEQCAWPLLVGQQMGTLDDWLQRLPQAIEETHPSLGVMHALVLLYTHQWEAAAARLQLIEGAFAGGEAALEAHGRVLLGQVTACWSLLARLSGDLERAVALAERALALLPEAEATPLTRVLRLGARLDASYTSLVSGEVTPARARQVVELVADAGEAGYRLLSLRGLTLLAWLQALQGDLQQAAATYEEVAQVMRPEESRFLLESPGYYFGLGELLREWNELEAAAYLLARGMKLMQGARLVDAEKVWLGYATLARVQQGQGKQELALATVESFLQVAQHGHFAAALLARGVALRAQLELAQGQLQAAGHWAERSGLSTTAVPSYRREGEYLTLARVRIAEARARLNAASLAEVLVLLERLQAEAESTRRTRSVLEILLLRALALEAQGNRSAALAALGGVLSLAEPQGYMRLFLDEGPPLVALLHEARRQGLAPRYLARLLEAAGQPGVIEIPRHAPPANALVEPLTAREREVLLLLLEGTANRGIAHKLVLSVNTVKKHVMNIYGKLGVQSRTQAVAKVRTLPVL